MREGTSFDTVKCLIKSQADDLLEKQKKLFTFKSTIDRADKWEKVSVNNSIQSDLKLTLSRESGDEDHVALVAISDSPEYNSSTRYVPLWTGSKD